MSLLGTMQAYRLDQQFDRVMEKHAAARTSTERREAQAELDELGQYLRENAREDWMACSRAAKALGVTGAGAVAKGASAQVDQSEFDAMPQELRCSVLQVTAALEAAQGRDEKTQRQAMRDAAPVLARLEQWRAGRKFRDAAANTTPIVASTKSGGLKPLIEARSRPAA